MKQPQWWWQVWLTGCKGMHRAAFESMNHVLKICPFSLTLSLKISMSFKKIFDAMKYLKGGFCFLNARNLYETKSCLEKQRKKKTVWAFQNLTNMTGSPYCSLEQHYCRCQCYDVKRLKGKQTFHKSPGSFPFPPPLIGNNFCKTFFPKRKRF